MNKLPLDKNVSKKQAFDLLNLIHSLLERYVHNRSIELEELYRIVSLNRNEFVKKFVKVRINELYEHTLLDVKIAYKRAREECEERQSRINLWMNQYKDKIPPGFPSSPVADLNDCINIFYHNTVLTQYEIELQNMFILNDIREGYVTDKSVNKQSNNVTYMFARNN